MRRRVLAGQNPGRRPPRPASCTRTGGITTSRPAPTGSRVRGVAESRASVPAARCRRHASPRSQGLARPRYDQRLRPGWGRLARFRADCLSTGRRRLQARLGPQRVTKPGTLAQMFTFAGVPWFPLTGAVRGTVAAPPSAGTPPALRRRGGPAGCGAEYHIVGIMGWQRPGKLAQMAYGCGSLAGDALTPRSATRASMGDLS
jgi:hypothetical protein